MYDLALTRLRGCAVKEDREAALRVLHLAIASSLIPPREAIELMLVIRDGSSRSVIEAIDAMRAGLPGSYRYVPTPDYAAA
jgi:hypothetical protein